MRCKSGSCVLHDAVQALQKGGAQPAADSVAAMATDDPAEAEDASDGEDMAVDATPTGGGKPGKKRASKEFHHKVIFLSDICSSPAVSACQPLD